MWARQIGRGDKGRQTNRAAHVVVDLIAQNKIINMGPRRVGLATQGTITHLSLLNQNFRKKNFSKIFLFFKFVVFDSEESDVLVNRTGILGVCVLKWDKAIYNREMCSILWLSLLPRHHQGQIKEKLKLTYRLNHHTALVAHVAYDFLEKRLFKQHTVRYGKFGVTNSVRVWNVQKDFVSDPNFSVSQNTKKMLLNVIKKQ